MKDIFMPEGVDSNFDLNDAMRAGMPLPEAIECRQESQIILKDKKLDTSGPIPIKPTIEPVPEFNLSLLPEAFKDWILDEAQRVGAPIEYVAVSAMVAVAGLIGNSASIQPKQYDDWKVVPNLWGVVVGRPSSMKSPSINKGTEFLKLLESENFKNFDEVQARYELELDGQKIKKTVAKRNQEKSAMKGGEVDVSALDIPDPEKPTCERLIVNDATVEKLGELLNENPQGLTVIHDEVIALLAKLEREDSQGERAFYLTAFDGKEAFTYDRIGRGTKRIESTTVSIIGGIQPSKIRPYFEKLDGAGDGLLQRFQLMVYPDIQKTKTIDRLPNLEARERAFCQFCQCRTQAFSEYKFDSQAQEVFTEWYEENHELAQSGDLSEALESHIGKYGSLVASLALIDHIVDGMGGNKVTFKSLSKAIAWSQLLFAHAKRIYSLTTDYSEPALNLLKKLDKLPQEFSARDVYRHGWSGLTNNKVVGEVLQLLVDHGYLLEILKQDTGGRPRKDYRRREVIQ